MAQPATGWLILSETVAQYRAYWWLSTERTGGSATPKYSMSRKKQFKNSTDVRRELSSLYHLVHNNLIELRKAETLRGILNSIQISVNGENKENELDMQDRLVAELEKARGKV